MNAFGVVIAIVMGAILGFAAHRAGLCTVKAVAEIMTTRRANVLISFIKSTMWVMAIMAVASAFAMRFDLRHVPAGSISFLGGLAFGLGAGINGGCTFSTLSRLVEGDVNLFATVAMWPVGMCLIMSTLPGVHSGMMIGTPSSWVPWWLATAVVAWVIIESILIARRIKNSGSWRRSFLAPAYTLSSGAALIGVANALLVISWGPWSFTGVILCGLDGRTPARCGSSIAVPLLVAVAALLGMLMSSVQRRSFRLARPQLREMLRHAVGGLLMGSGAILIPGGNDGLILFAIPSLSPHAIPAYVGVLAGIAMALFVMRASGVIMRPILCENDICKTT